MDVNEIDLERKDIEVLHEVANSGDRGVTTSGVVDVVGWADDDENHKVIYRFDKLEDRGYITSQQESGRGPGNQIDPRVARVTDDGRELAEEVEFDPSNSTMEERVERLEKQFKPIRDTYGEVKKRISDLEKDIEEHDEDLDDIAEEIENVKRAMDAGAPTDSEEDGLASELDFVDD